MANDCEYVPLGKLLPYQMALQLSRDSWKIYKRLNWQDKKIMGYQFITAIDSGGANFAEGYGRFHYLDRIKFYYNARGSALEAKHWTLLLRERGKITEEEFNNLISQLNAFHKQLNSFIKTCYSSKDKQLANI